MTATLVERAPAGLTAEDCAARLGGRSWFAWLDGGSDHAGLGRWSYLSAEPWAAYRAFGERTERREAGGGWIPVPGDILTAMGEELRTHATEPLAGAPAFQGGAVGYLAYDWGRVLERRSAARYADLALPEAVFGLYDLVVAWDHHAGEGWLVSTGLPCTGAARAARARERLAALRGWLTARGSGPALGDALVAHPGERPAGIEVAPSWPVLALEGAEQVGLRSTFTHRGYLSAVQRVREYILAGDIFQ
ncbi:MAG TPA: hypothetical protein VFX50_11770, partial [Gemmatimonadales bacterium]|nr:hypothetical protein [Gemmatimonadales bacterium]